EQVPVDDVGLYGRDPRRAVRRQRAYEDELEPFDQLTAAGGDLRRGLFEFVPAQHPAKRSRCRPPTPVLASSAGGTSQEADRRGEGDSCPERSRGCFVVRRRERDWSRSRRWW